MLGVQGSFPEHWAGAIGMNNGFDPFSGLGFPDASQMLALPLSFNPSEKSVGSEVIKREETLWR
jgi:hypothetical protein